MASLLVETGRAFIPPALAAAWSFFIGWGTGAGTTAAGDTTLFAESTEPRSLCSAFVVTTTVADDTLRLIGLITATDGRSITNAGVFDAAAAGNLFVKADFPTETVLTGEAIQFTWDITFA
jgi:hypothetical protein